MTIPHETILRIIDNLTLDELIRWVERNQGMTFYMDDVQRCLFGRYFSQQMPDANVKFATGVSVNGVAYKIKPWMKHVELALLTVTRDEVPGETMYFALRTLAAYHREDIA